MKDDMNTRPQPATPLPWRTDEYIRERVCAESDRDAQVCKVFTIPRGADDAQTDRARQQDAAYIVAACNAYPRLLAERAELLRVVQHFAAMPDVLSVAENEQINELLRRIGEAA